MQSLKSTTRMRAIQSVLMMLELRIAPVKKREILQMVRGTRVFYSVATVRSIANFISFRGRRRMSQGEAKGTSKRESAESEESVT